MFLRGSHSYMKATLIVLPLLFFINPEEAIFCGRHSLAHYVDAFIWVGGAVGFHISSQECQTPKNKGSQVWCRMMLE